MEKKNNQMVDKEKELKNVAPDTDVAPDVTDASSFQGGPSHTSSNRQQMRLINRIDYYKWKINLLTELISVERENLEKSRDKRTDAYKERQRRKIFPLKLKASDVDEAVEELYGRDIEKFDKRQKLNFREYRQNLRRAEGLLNPDGTLKRFELDAEGNEIPFENVLSAESQELLKAFEVSQAEQRAAFMEGLRVKAVAAVGEGAADAEDIYEAARLEDETALESFVAEENAKIEKRMEKYVEATQFKINRYNEKLLSMQEKLAELMAEEEAKFGVELPSDVILRLDRLTMEFGGLKAVNNLSFDVKKGEIFGLIGPNGAGKTTVFNCITQFYKPTGGLIYYRNREDKVIVLNKYQVHDVIKTGIVRTFQNVEVIYELSILDNLLIAAHTQYKSNIFAQMFNTKGVKQEEAVNRPATVPNEATSAEASDIYGGAWVIIDDSADERQKADLLRFIAICDWGVEKGIISRSTADSYLISAYAMSSFIALDVFMTGIDRLADKEITREAFLEAMESAPINVPISGGVNYANGQRIGLDGMSFVKYVRPTEAGAAASTGTFVNVVGMQSIDQILGELDDAE